MFFVAADREALYSQQKKDLDYTVEMTSRLKGLDLIECLKNYGQRFMTLYMRQ